MKCIEKTLRVGVYRVIERTAQRKLAVIVTCQSRLSLPILHFVLKV